MTTSRGESKRMAAEARPRERASRVLRCTAVVAPLVAVLLATTVSAAQHADIRPPATVLRARADTGAALQEAITPTRGWRQAVAGDARSFAIRARAVYPVTAAEPGPIENGMLIVRDGRIVAVGQDLRVPDGLRLIEMPDAVICPGFIDAASALVGPHRGPESVSGAYRALDAYDQHGGYRVTLSRGTTTVHLDPGGHRLVSGLGCVVKLAGPPEHRTLVAAADLTVNFGVFDPPALVDPPFYASSDVPIEPSQMQRPDSRLGQYLELNDRIAIAESWISDSAAYQTDAIDRHLDAFIEAWAAGLPLRVQVHEAEDIEGALAFVSQHDRPAYLVGLTEAAPLAAELTATNLPLVLRIEEAYRHPARDIGDGRDVIEPRASTAGVLAHGPAQPRVALAGPEGDWAADVRTAALLAVRGGMPAEQALAAITRIPAEILGIDERVGSLAPGKDADFLVLTDNPLAVSSHVARVYVDGALAFEAPGADALVVKGGTLWVGDGTLIHDGALLVEDGKITAVGRRVPHPPFARVIDAGPDAFLTPGFIDAHGHLGLQGDRSVVSADVPLHRLIAASDRMFTRVARAGVTTVLMAPYRVASNGARITAIKTYGGDRDELVAREIGGVRFAFLDDDPLLDIRKLKGVIEAGKKYAAQWQKYEEELAKWRENGDEAKPDKDEPEEETDEAPEQPATDPITGIWDATLSGDPLPEEVQVTMTLKLTGNQIEGRLSDPAGSGEEVVVRGTLEGKQVELELEQETPVGKPRIVATLDAEDHMAGSVNIGPYAIAFEATRTDKGPVEFKIQRRRGKDDDGRPMPPKINEALEPLRPLLAKEIPAVVEVQTPAQIDAVVQLFVDEYELPLVLLDARGAADVADMLVERRDKLGVIVPPQLERWRRGRPYNQAVDLGRQGIPVALQSDSEDGARNLPLMGLFAVQQGLGGDGALRALTSDAARLYKLEDRVGSLQPGRDGDVLIFDRHPFDAGAQLRRVIVGGKEVPND